MLTYDEAMARIYQVFEEDMEVQSITIERYFGPEGDEVFDVEIKAYNEQSESGNSYDSIEEGVDEVVAAWLEEER